LVGGGIVVATVSGTVDDSLVDESAIDDSVEDPIDVDAASEVVVSVSSFVHTSRTSDPIAIARRHSPAITAPTPHPGRRRADFALGATRANAVSATDTCADE